MNRLISYPVTIAAFLVMTNSYAQTADQNTNPNADNSAMNKRDHQPDSKTADHQMKASTSSTEITRQIRRELTKDSTLSTYGKNVKIITDDSSVTLRGPVKTADEKTKIGNVAQNVSKLEIKNELEVKQ